MAASVDKDLCIRCGSCEPECPVDAIYVGIVAEIRKDKCIECGNCVDACPVGAITLD